MYYFLAGITGLLTAAALFLFGSLLIEMPGVVSERLVAILLPAAILLITLYAALTYLIKQITDLGLQLGSIYRTVDRVQKEQAKKQ